MQEKNYLLWKKAEEQYCLGNFDAAKQMYNELTSDDQYFIKAHQRISSLSVSEHQLDINNLVLVYQTGKKYCSSMVKLLIRNIPLIGEVEDYSDEVCHQHLYTKFYSNMIVVDHAIKSIESYQYYLKCKLSGCNVILIHLADEGYQDIYEIYDFCSLVFRNYWSPILDGFRKVHHFPLGVGDSISQQYPALDKYRLSSERKFLWNFLGDATKSDRQHSIQTFSNLYPHKLHLVSNFFDPNKINTIDYLNILGDSKFTLCPDGNVNVDSYRVWEAIEMGSIPLIVNRGNYKYFQGLTKSELPFPTFNSWEDAAIFAERLQNDDVALNWLQQGTKKWWESLKICLPKNFACAVNSC